MPSSRRQFLAGSLAALGAPWVARGALAAAPVTKKLVSFNEPAERLLGRLTLAEKVGQMTQVDQSFLHDLEDLQKYHLGSLLSGGDSDPKTGNDFASWRNMFDRYQSQSLKTQPRIPILYGADTVHGHNNVIGATIFPHNIGLGCTRNAALVEKAERVTAVEVRSTGIQWGFGPCVAVPQDVRWGRTYEGFSESPDVVKVLGAAAVRGMQGSGLGDPLGIVACAKHYAGDGGTAFGTGIPEEGKGSLHFPLDQGDTRLSDADFRRIHLQGYVTAVAAGVATVMPSYSSWNGVKCSADYVLLTEILKQEMGFQGFLISDYSAEKELPGSFKQQIETTINAGMDMVMVPDTYQDFIRLLTELVQERRVAMARIDDAVRRILRVKFAMGLMDPGRSQLADPALAGKFGSPEHRAVARQCVRESLVVLKNEHSVLPLAPSGRIHVAGKCADDIGNQCGGWTITWQGKSGNTTTGTTVLAALRKAAGAGRVTYSPNGEGAEGARVAIAVIGETPYAEMRGDRSDLSLDPQDVAVVDTLKRAGVPVVVVMISGRPLAVDELLPKVDALVAAWLPGTEGAGVADILMGKYKPSGKLSFTWPRGNSTSFHLGDPGYETLFPFGFGLNWA